jgi:hypothetical protein
MAITHTEQGWGYQHMSPWVQYPTLRNKTTKGAPKKKYWTFITSHCGDGFMVVHNGVQVYWLTCVHCIYATFLYYVSVKLFFKKRKSQVLVVHIYNPSYSGSRDQED